jgi:glucose/arabinose dehydrogenase
MAFAPDGRLFITEKAGAVKVLKNGSVLPTPFLKLSTNSPGERGLLGFAFDPDFNVNKFVYAYYTVADGSHNRLSRFTANGDAAVTGSERVLMDMDPLSTATNHNGGAVHFGPDRKLYVAVGDNANGANAQTLANVHGKMLRLNSDGSIPTDNPFYNQTSGKQRAIWALGLRNPFTFAFQPGSGRMFINDVGQNTWEEIDEGARGANYGWPTTEGPTSDARFRAPFYAYDHGTGIAITGGAFYNPPTRRFPADYAGDYFFADFGRGFIKRIDPVTRAVSPFATNVVRVVDLDVGADGSLYYLSNTDAGGVFRVSYTGSGAPSIGTQPQSRTVSVGRPATFAVTASGTGTLGYQWQRNGVNIAGATAASYTLPSAALSDSGATFRVIVRNAAGSATSSSATLTVTSNKAPTAAITAPSSGSLYNGGSVISYAGSGADPEQGTLPASAFTWSVDFHHDTHSHPFIAPFSGTKGGTFTIPTAGETSANVWYRIRLTVKDAGGLTHTVTRDVLPRKATVKLATNVAGLKLSLDGQPVTSPASFTGVVGVRRAIGAPATQSLNGVSYQFVSWSDGGAATHTVATPSAAATYTATYRAVAGTTSQLAALAAATVRDGASANVNYGSDATLYVKANDGNVNRQTYLKFDLASVATVNTAKLRLFGTFSGPAGGWVETGVFAAADTGWGESSLTWNNRPAPGTAVLARQTITAGAPRWYEFDLSAYLRQQKAAGRNLVTLVLKNLSVTNNLVTVNSDEAAANRPQLVMT